ncbi:MAG: hypothetical protein V4727_12545 [Verrucomicrobiota bacterium]
MIPTQKKTPEELAALREEQGVFQRPNSPELPPEIPATPDPSPTDEQLLEPSEPVAIRPKKRKIHTLRKFELPLAPAPVVENKTPLPQYRRRSTDIAETRRREALANFSATPIDPAAHLKKLAAHPVLLTFAYLPAFVAIYTAWNTFHFITPISLIFVSSLLTAYIFWKKKRSRHHAAILFIILVMTLVFGGIHYAPYFSAYAS